MPLIKLFWEICLFKRGPDAIPLSLFLLSITFASYILIGFVLLMLEGESWFKSLFQPMVEPFMLLGFVWTLLSFVNLKQRFIQTGTALLATDALISSFSFPLFIWSQFFPETQGIHLMFVMLMFWHIAVVANIISQALSKPLLMGMGLAFVYIVFSYEMMALLFS